MFLTHSVDRSLANQPAARKNSGRWIDIIKAHTVYLILLHWLLWLPRQRTSEKLTP